ncbi:MAG: hypothetical protein WCD79_01655 [Chthoniobacteraceae bacterium]
MDFPSKLVSHPAIKLRAAALALCSCTSPSFKIPGWRTSPASQGKMQQHRSPAFQGAKRQRCRAATRAASNQIVAHDLSINLL